MTKVINFCAGPSAGKTSNGLYLAAQLKFRRKDVLYIPEFAMEEVVKDRIVGLDDQVKVFAEQANRLYHAKDKFEYVVTDAPLFMMLFYMKKANKKFAKDRNYEYWKLTLRDLIVQTFAFYDNTTFFVDRGEREFRQLGRIHNEEQSKEIDKEILQILEDHDLEYTYLDASDEREPLDYLLEWNVVTP